jgi:hypothetical protein
VVCAETVGIPATAHSTRGVSLGIAIYQEALDFGRRKGGSQIDGSCSFSDATFLIGNSDHSTHCSTRFWISTPIKSKRRGCGSATPLRGAMFYVEQSAQ